MAILKENLSVEREIARRNTDKHPSENQARAGNYKKGKIKFNGFLITIENPKGSYRRGKDKDGHEWKTLMHNDYGYFNRTVGKDGDAIDVFLGPNLNSKKIFPIDQFLNGQFDETKVMLGFNTAEEAKAAYLSNYEKDWKGFKYITEIDLETFKRWLYDGYRQRKPFAKYARLTENKERQLGIINDTNPMLDDYHTGIRKVEDIKTFEEAMAEAKADFDEYGYYSSYPDTPNSVLENALKTGKITVYSSKPISNGNFVTTSKMCAKDYAGGGKVYSETLPTEDIAWINVEEGQVARLNKLNEEMSTRIYDAMEDYSYVDLLNEFLSDKKNGIPQKRWNLIPFEQYRNVRERFLREPQMARIPLNLVTSWFDIIIHNTLSISYITDFAGHSQYFPSEDLEEVFGVYADYSEGWKVLDKEGFYDWAKLPDGSDAWSDYGLSPLYKIIGEYSENMEPGDVLMLIDRALDVSHCRGNLASAFIEGGSKSCDNITSKSTLNESPDDCGEHDYMDSDSFSFLKVDGKYYISEPGQNHEELFNELISDGIVDEKGIEDKSLIWDTTGRYWEDSNILSFWNTPLGNELPVMREVVNFLSSQRGIQVDSATLLIDIWDIQSINECLIPYRWFNNGTFDVLFDILQDVSQYDKDTFCVKTKKGTYYVDWAGNIMSMAEFYSKYSQVSESKKQRKNDKGEVVPETCECGGKVCVQIHGEPVFICNKCGKYYGTLPFTNESIDIKKALKNLKKRRDPANIENWNDMINEGFSSLRLAQLAKEHGGIKISRNGGLRDFPCAFINGYSVNPSEITDDMIIDDGDYNNCIEFNDGTIVGLRKDSEVSHRTAGERKANRLGSGVGDTGDHDKSRGGFIGNGKDSVSTPYNGYAVSDKAGEAQALRNSLEFNKATGDKRGEEDIRRRARNLANVAESEEKDINKEIGKAIRRGNREADIEAHGKSVAFRPSITKNPKAYTRKVKHKEPLAEGRRVYLTEEQFKAYCRQILREKRNEDYLKEIIKESLNK